MFSAKVVIVHKGIQIKETEILNPIIRHLARERLQKLIVFADRKPLPSAMMSQHMSKFNLSTLLLLDERIIEADIPYEMLVTQYRMHPHIAETVSQLSMKALREVLRQLPTDRTLHFFVGD